MDDAELGIELPDITTNDLLGTWHIVRTTFPMWLNPKHSDPTLNYARIPGADASLLADQVEYRRRGQAKRIRGIDRQDPACSCRFEWRGHGLLALLTSAWTVVDLDRTNGVVVIYFSKTWFTPAGLDVATRAEAPDDASIDACLARVRVAPRLRSHVEQLVTLTGSRGRRSDR